MDRKETHDQENNGKNKVEEAEVSAEFTILDASKANGYKNTDLDTEENRKDYIDSLAKDAVIGTITTDAKESRAFFWKT